MSAKFIIIAVLLLFCAVFSNASLDSTSELRTCSAMCLSRSFMSRNLRNAQACIDTCVKHVEVGKVILNSLKDEVARTLADGEDEEQQQDNVDDAAAAVDTNFALKASVGSHNVYGNAKGAFYKSELTIDADGAYRAYHPKNIGLDYLANAGTPGNWWALVTDNGKTNGKPIVQKDTDPAPGYYISTTTLEDQTKDRKDPRRYVDSESIPYYVLPPQVREAIGAKLGDVGLVLYNGKRTYAIFADVGPRKHLGEGSIALAKILGIPSNPKAGGIEGNKVTYIVFPKSSNGKLLTVAEINAKGKAAFEAWGGEVALNAAIAKLK